MVKAHENEVGEELTDSESRMTSAPNIPETADSVMVEPANASSFHREKQETWKRKPADPDPNPKQSQRWVFPSGKQDKDGMQERIHQR
jgi:hypothetical protein